MHAPNLQFAAALRRAEADCLATGHPAKATGLALVPQVPIPWALTTVISPVLASPTEAIRAALLHSCILSLRTASCIPVAPWARVPWHHGMA